MNVPALLFFLEKSHEDIRKFIKRHANQGGKDYFIFLPKDTKNKICLVSHMDTVFKTNHRDIFHDIKKNVYWSPDGLGADDRAGVYACLKLFNETPEPYKPIVIITDGEESGGYGAQEVAEAKLNLWEGVKYLIELDRQGENDCCFYNSEPKDFITYIENFGFREATGSFTDIEIIGLHTALCGVNLSIGYYNNHSNKEYLKMNELNTTMKKVGKMLTANTEQWPLPEECMAAKMSSQTIYYTDGVCAYCKAPVKEEKIMQVDGELLCGECFYPLEIVDDTMECEHCETTIPLYGYCCYCGQEGEEEQ